MIVPSTFVPMNIHHDSLDEDSLAEAIVKGWWEEKDRRDKEQADREERERQEEWYRKNSERLEKEFLEMIKKSEEEDRKKSLKQRYEEAMEEGDLAYAGIIAEAAERKGIKL